MRVFSKVFAGIILFIVLSANLLVTWLDRTPYKEEVHYAQTLSALDRYHEYREEAPVDSLYVGWSERSLIPQEDITSIPLAGYGARDPKNALGIHDSVFVRTIVLANRYTKIALVSADLLIIHPELSRRVYETAKKYDWTQNEIYFGATHTHSSLGAWAPGKVGDLFAGTYDPEMVNWLADQLVQSIVEAEQAISAGNTNYGEVELPDLIRNRLVGEQGITDPFAKVLFFQNENGRAVDLSYGAHATCLGPEWKEVSGDYPAVFQEILSDTLFAMASFRAGAVASMTAFSDSYSDWPLAEHIGTSLGEQVGLLSNLSPSGSAFAAIESYQVPLYLGPPQLKVSQNLVLRPWLFKQLVGDYPTYINVATIDKTLMIGLPCDFSGELAVPLYAYARQKGLNLIINSFNGGYIGYVPKDEWYDLDKYETRTMAWYGHDTGAYFTEIIKRIIDHHA
jgi:neutral ceramidase